MAKITSFFYKILISVNYGELLLKALFEHWPRTYLNEEDDHSEGETGVATQNGHPHHAGNEFFSIPPHTPVIIRQVKILLKNNKFLCILGHILFIKKFLTIIFSFLNKFLMQVFLFLKILI